VRAAGISAVGGPVETLEVPDPRALGADEVLIEVRAAGVGNWDDYHDPDWTTEVRRIARGRGITVSNVYVRPDGRQLAVVAELAAQAKLTVEVGATFAVPEAARALDTATAGIGGRAVALEL
jgi:hypothetical protein